MDPEYVASTVGAAVSALLALVVFLPALLLAGVPGVADYYASGPVGVSVVGFLGVLNAVVLLSGTRGRAESDLVAGIAVTVGVASVALALIWSVAVDTTLLFSFPARYAWVQYHRWVVVAGSLLAAGCAGAYARAVL
ncbi:MAG: hypothetical protein ABEJ22_08970 [Haloferacaceae archaeon]